MDELVLRACATERGYSKLGHEMFTAAGATFIRNRATPRRYDSNHVGEATCETPDAIDRLLARMDVEYAGYPYRRITTDPTTPPQLCARLELDGWSTGGHEVKMILEGPLLASPKPCDIRLVESDADWTELRELMALDWRETAERRGEAFDDALVDEFVTAKRQKSPPVRFFIAYVDGMARANFAAWAGENGVGMVEDLFTHPDVRRLGLATALIAHCVSDARGRGAGPVLIGADVNDTPRRMYAAMGFRPLYVLRNYFRRVEVAEG